MNLVSEVLFKKDNSSGCTAINVIGYLGYEQKVQVGVAFRKEWGRLKLGWAKSKMTLNY